MLRMASRAGDALTFHWLLLHARGCNGLETCLPGPFAAQGWIAGDSILGCVGLPVMQVQQIVQCWVSHKPAWQAVGSFQSSHTSQVLVETGIDSWHGRRYHPVRRGSVNASVLASQPCRWYVSYLASARESDAHTTLAPAAPSAGAAAASQICFGRLLPALYLKLGTFLPSPPSAISPLPPLPDLQPSKPQTEHFASRVFHLLRLICKAIDMQCLSSWLQSLT